MWRFYPRFLALGVILLLLCSSSKEIFPVVENEAFGVGEKLRYRLSYGIIDAGEVTLYLKWTDRKGHGRPLYHAVGKGYSINTFDHVINCLMDVCGHNEFQAYQCALIVHTAKQCSIAVDTYEECFTMFKLFKKLGLLVTIEKYKKECYKD